MKGNDYQLKLFLTAKEINNSCKYVRKCIENSLESLYTDLRGLRVKGKCPEWEVNCFLIVKGLSPGITCNSVV